MEGQPTLDALWESTSNDQNLSGLNSERWGFMILKLPDCMEKRSRDLHVKGQCLPSFPFHSTKTLVPLIKLNLNYDSASASVGLELLHVSAHHFTEVKAKGRK